ncbi:glycosyltransferase [Planctomicrobium sp.]|nr:glycosyltransferase [Planctomicrobium sp.]MDA7503614.1 glycosyltransferase [bacterium]MDB4743445.1 glycosyltransferase [Planctomicrobium sp.]
MDEHSEETIDIADGVVVFADDWGRHPSSCQHLIRRLRERHKVLWVNTIGTRSPTVDSFTLFRGAEKFKSWSRGLQKVHENMWVVDAPMLPGMGSRVSRFVSHKIVNSYLKICLHRIGVKKPAMLTTLPHTGWLVGDIRQTQTIYYCTDDYSSWRGADQSSLIESEQQLVKNCSKILAVSKALVERLSAASESVHHFSHAVDFELFSSAMRQSHKPRLEAYPSPRVGFFGLIYEKLDFELLAKLAKAINPASLVMIGPIDFCDQRLKELENVYFTDKVSYDELPEWISGLDVLILPYLADDVMIRQSSPLKLRECLATGIPTVSVNVSEVKNYLPFVDIADSHDEFIKMVRACLESPERLEARQNAVQSETWEHRSRQLENYLKISLEQH